MASGEVLVSLVEDVARDDVEAVRRKLGGNAGLLSGLDEAVEGGGLWSALHEAAAEGRVDCAEVLLRYGAQVGARSSLGDTPLHLAAARGNGDMLKALLFHGADVEAKNGRGETALLMAARQDQSSSIHLLLTHGADVTAKDHDDHTLLHYPGCLRQVGLLKQVLARGADSLLDVQTKDTGDSPLHLAVESGGLEVIQILIQAGAKVELRNHLGRSPLHLAARWGRVDALRLLRTTLHSVEQELDSPDMKGDSLLHLAAQFGHLKVVNEVLKWGVAVDGKNNEANTPLHLASMNNHFDIASALISKGADSNVRNAAGKRPCEVATSEGHLLMARGLSDPSGMGSQRRSSKKFPRRNLSFALHRAVRENDVALLLQSLMHGADINQQDDDGNSTLHIAARIGNEPVASFLLKRGADPMLSNSCGNLAMHLAAVNGHHKIMRLLAEKEKGHVQFNFHNADGWTPLHFAIFGITSGTEQLNMQTLDVILSSDKVLVNAKSRKGVTALQFAVSRHCPEAMEYLLRNFGDYRGVSLSEEFLHIPKKLESTCSLFKALYCERDDIFLRFLTNCKDVNENDGSHTLLQLACVLGLDTCVDRLLQRGANPNAICSGCPVPPLLLAASWGYFKVLDVLMRWKSVRLNVTANDGSNIFHVLCYGLQNKLQAYYSPFVQINLNTWNQDYDACIQKLLIKMKKKGDFPFFINDKDEESQTPLHLAVSHRFRSTIVLMLLYGADPWAENNNKFIPIDGMTEATISEYLDCCVQEDDKSIRHGQQVIVKFDLLMPSTNAAEFVRLEYFKESSSRKNLLKHPVFSAFLYFKYKCISFFCYLNLLLYGIFLTSWTLGLMLDNYIVNYIYVNKIENASVDPYVVWLGDIDVQLIPIQSVTWLILFAREMSQLIGSFRTYFLSWENYMELTILFILPIYVYLLQSDSEYNAFDMFIFLSWMEFVLLVGRLPILAKYLAMFSTVLKNYLYILAVFIYLLIGFAITFYLSFHICHEDGTCEKIFKSPMTVSLKMMVMILGEVDFEDLPFQKLPLTTHFLFLLFLFLVVLVLMNLLNALAVSDTQAIADQAELYRHLSLVNLVCYIESFFFSKVKKTSRFKKWFRCERCDQLLQWLRKCCLCSVYYKIWGRLRDHVLLFPKIPKGQIVVDLRDGKVLMQKGWKLPKDIVHLLQVLLENKDKRVEGDDELVARSIGPKLEALQDSFKFLQEDVMNLKEKHELSTAEGYSCKLQELEISQMQLLKEMDSLRREMKNLISILLDVVERFPKGDKQSYVTKL